MLLVRSYLSERDKDEFEVRVSVSSLMALWTSIMDMAESIRNMRRTTTKVTVQIVERPFRLEFVRNK